MEKIITEPVKEIWGHITGLSSPITHFARTVSNYLFSSHNPTHQHQKSNWQILYYCCLGTFLFLAYELLIKPAIEFTSLYLWLKNLPATCYFTFLTFSWPIKIAVGLSIIFAIGLAFHEKYAQDQETKTAEALTENLSEQSKKQHQDNMDKLTQNGNRLELAVQQLQQDLQGAKNEIQQIQSKHWSQLAQKTQLDQIRHHLNLTPLPALLVKNEEDFLAEQHNLGKILAQKILENLNSQNQVPAIDHALLSTQIDKIKEGTQALNTQQTNKDMAHALDLLNLFYNISIQIHQGAYIQAQDQVEAVKTNNTVTTRHGSHPLLLDELEKLLTTLRNSTQPSSNAADNTTSQDNPLATASTSTANAAQAATLASDQIIPAHSDANTANTEASNTTPPATQTPLCEPTSIRNHLFSLPHLFDLSAHPTFAKESACTIS